MISCFCLAFGDNGSVSRDVAVNREDKVRRESQMRSGADANHAEFVTQFTFCGFLFLSGSQNGEALLLRFIFFPVQISCSFCSHVAFFFRFRYFLYFILTSVFSVFHIQTLF